MGVGGELKERAGQDLSSDLSYSYVQCNFQHTINLNLKSEKSTKFLTNMLLMWDVTEKQDSGKSSNLKYIKEIMPTKMYQ